MIKWNKFSRTVDADDNDDDDNDDDDDDDDDGGRGEADESMKLCGQWSSLVCLLTMSYDVITLTMTSRVSSSSSSSRHSADDSSSRQAQLVSPTERGGVLVQWLMARADIEHIEHTALWVSLSLSLWVSRVDDIDRSSTPHCDWTHDPVSWLIPADCSYTRLTLTLLIYLLVTSHDVSRDPRYALLLQTYYYYYYYYYTDCVTYCTMRTCTYDWRWTGLLQLNCWSAAPLLVRLHAVLLG